MRRNGIARHRLKLAVLLLVAMLVAACAGGGGANRDTSSDGAPGPGSTDGSSGTGTKDETIFVAVPNDPSNWDYDFVQGDIVALSMVKNVQPHLFDHPHADGGAGYSLLDSTQLVGVYADSYEISEDGLVWTVKLKEGLSFPDGAPVTAEAFRWSKERGLSQNSNAQFTYGSMLGITDASQIKVIDEMTLEITHGHFSAMQPYMHVVGGYFFNPAQLQEHATADDPWALEWHGKNPGHGGPYVVAEAVQGQRYVLVRNENWPGEVKNDRVEVQVVPSSASRVLMLKKGDVDIVYGLTSRDALTLDGSDGIKVISVPTIDSLYLIPNHSIAPFDNVHFRRALAYAMPFADVVNKVYQGNAQPMRSLLPTGMPGSTDRYWVYDTNLDKAREELALSGYAGARIELTIEAGVPEHEQVALLVRDALKQIGVDVEIQQLDATTLAEQRTKRTIPFSLTQGVAWINDPEYLMNSHYVSDGFLNWGDYNNPRIDEIVRSSSTVVDLDERLAMYDEVQQIAMDELPIIPLAQPNFVIAMRDHLNGFVYAPDGLYRLWTLSK